LVLGLILGLVGAVVGTLVAGDFQIGLVIGVTLPPVVVWSNTVATLVPLAAERFKIDPTVISAPMITTIVDASALLIYFLLAGAILSV
jgi:magnesium transporter